MKATMSITSAVTAITALVIAAAMLAYALVQYASMPDMPFWKLLVGHSWHVLVLGALSYVALHGLLHKVVVGPVHKLHLKLYKIAHGDNTPMEIATHIREIQDISESVNLMLAQFRLTSHDPWVGKLRDAAEKLRALSKGTSDGVETPDLEMLVHTASELEELAMVIERFEAKAQNLDSVSL